MDRIYMTFVQASTGSGGWPMSVFLTPELKPFFGGTYFPPDNRYGRPGFGAILERIAEAWRNERERIVQSSGDVDRAARAICGQRARRRRACRTRRCSIPRSSISAACSIQRMADSEARRSFHVRWFSISCCGITRGPDRQEALDMTLETLRAMAKGGMHDQLGGGFHRYSVDERWFVPHFEKMLYDQAQLAMSYLEAFQITHDPLYAKIARSTLDYVLRDMTHPEGGFYSAEDADSVIDPANPKEKGEGAFYIWSAAELKQALGASRSSALRRCMAWSRTATFTRIRTASSRARTFCICASRWTTRPRRSCEPAKATLLAIRSKRVRPHLDDKILTAWNGLMISAFAKGAQVLDEPRYLEAAQRAAQFHSDADVRRGVGRLAAPLSRW